MMARRIEQQRRAVSHDACEIDARERVSRLETCRDTFLSEIAPLQIKGYTRFGEEIRRFRARQRAAIAPNSLID